MTDHHDPLDELASAHLDGLTTPEEAAAVAADPTLSRRVERFAAARDLLRSTAPAVDPERRSRAIAAALAAFDDDRADLRSDIAAASAPVIDLASRRRTRRTLQLVGAAAAVALAALAIPFVDQLDSGSTGGSDVAAPTTKDMAATEAAADAAGGATSTVAPGAPPPELGSFADFALLAEAVRSQIDSDGPTAAQASPAPTRETSCADEPALQPIAYIAFAELGDRAVVVVVRDEPDGGRTLVVLDQQSCETVSAGRL